MRRGGAFPAKRSASRARDWFGGTRGRDREFGGAGDGLIGEEVDDEKRSGFTALKLHCRAGHVPKSRKTAEHWGWKAR